MMKNKFLGSFLVLFAFSLFLVSCGGEHNHAHDADGNHVEKTGKEYTSAYVCPMHCEGSGSDKAGKCPVCKMDYVANADHKADGHQHDNDANDGHDHGDHDGHNH